MNASYGTDMIALVDKSIDDTWRMQAIRATAEALADNESRLHFDTVQIGLADKTGNQVLIRLANTTTDITTSTAL